MDIRTLRIFLYLAETLHFGRTSQACCISPSALTRTIQRLEEELGQRLFERDNRTVTLTSAGEIFREYAYNLVDGWEEALEALSMQQKELSGHLSIYCSVTAGYTFLPRVLGRFRKEFPGIHLHLQTGAASDALLKVMNEEVDVTIAALPENLPESIESISVMDTPLLFVCSHEEKEHFEAQGWSRIPVILPDQGLARKRLEQWFRRRRIKPNIYAEVHGNEAILSMVSMGCGVSVVPKLVLDKSPLKDEVAVMDMPSQLKDYEVGVCCLRKRLTNPVVKAFWDMWLDNES